MLALIPGFIFNTLKYFWPLTQPWSLQYGLYPVVSLLYRAKVVGISFNLGNTVKDCVLVCLGQVNELMWSFCLLRNIVVLLDECMLITFPNTEELIPVKYLLLFRAVWTWWAGGCWIFQN